MQAVDVLLEKALKARTHAYAPYSHFLVGCCLETIQGHLFIGCNVENASYGLSVCAEANAISAMIVAGERKIAQMVIVVEGPGTATACGACRQRILEFSTQETMIYFCDLAGHQEQYTIDRLLPHAFSARDFLAT